MSSSEIKRKYKLTCPSHKNMITHYSRNIYYARTCSPQPPFSGHYVSIYKRFI